MDLQPPSLEALQKRISKLERQQRRSKRLMIGFVSPIVLVIITSAYIAVTAQTPLPQPSAPSKAPKATDRVSALESKVNSLSQRMTFMQTQITSLSRLALGTVRSSATGTTELEDEIEALEEKNRSLADDVDDLKSDVGDLKSDDVDRIKSDLDDLKGDMDSVKSANDEFKAFRKAICSFSWNPSAYTTLHTGYPAPCPLY